MTTHPSGPRGQMRWRPRRWAGAGLAATILSALAVLAPTPTVVSAQELEVQTERVVLPPRVADRARDRLAPALEASDEAPELRSALAARDRRGSAPRAADFLALGVTVADAPDEPILVRTKVGGQWTPWLEVPFAPGEAPDLDAPERRSDEIHSEPLWMGDAEAYELDAPGELRALDVHLVGEGPAQRRLTVEPSAAGAAGAPSILSRSAWGARAPGQHPSTTGDLKLAVVHHTVNGNSYSSAQVPQMLRSIQAYHQDVQGWNDIAYNFVVDRFGRTWEGRAGGTTNVVVGGHSQGFNTGAVGVVALGDFRSATPPAATVEAIAKVIAWKFALHRVDPASKVPFTSAGSSKYATGTVVNLPRIVGHRDVQSTDCPGGLLYNRLGTIRGRVAQLVPEYQKGLTSTLLAPDLTGDGLIDPLQYQPGRVADVQFRATETGQLIRTSSPVNGTYRPVVGDFDGNGRDDIFWYGSGTTGDFIWWSTPTGRVVQPIAIHGSYIPLVGDFDANGVDDIFWYSTGPATDGVWYFDHDRSHRGRVTRQDLITAVPLVGDFTGDGRDDIFWYGPGSADDRLWRSTGPWFTGVDQSVSGRYQPVALNAVGDQRAEILWLAGPSSTSYRWGFTTSGTLASSTPLAATSLTGRPSVGDFDGDGYDDVLISAAGGATDAVWYSTPSGIESRPVTVNGSYSIATGPMDSQVPVATDDIIFVSTTAADFLWRGQPGRTFVHAPAG